jgi:hypothetical protein
MTFKIGDVVKTNWRTGEISVLSSQPRNLNNKGKQNGRQELDREGDKAPRLPQEDAGSKGGGEDSGREVEKG